MRTVFCAGRSRRSSIRSTIRHSLAVDRPVSPSLSVARTLWRRRRGEHAGTDMGNLVFVSHSSQGDARCKQLRQCLLSELKNRGHEVFLDEDDLSPGDLWRPKIYRALAECNSAILLLSPQALKSKWVHTESAILAWRRDLRVHFGRQMSLIAVLLEG